MKQLAALALALCLVLPGGDPVRLLTGEPLPRNSCFASATGSGLLVADPTYGTAIIGQDSMAALGDEPMPVAWRPGFTARRIGSDVAVLDPQGNVVARTGRSYTIDGGLSSGPRGRILKGPCSGRATRSSRCRMRPLSYPFRRVDSASGRAYTARIVAWVLY